MREVTLCATSPDELYIRADEKSLTLQQIGSTKQLILVAKLQHIADCGFPI